MAKKLGIQILGLTTVAGNSAIDNVTKNAALVVEVCGAQKEIGVYQGMDKSITGHHYEDPYYGPDGFGGHLFDHLKDNPDHPFNIKEENAVDFLLRASTEHPGEITLICIAPMTNIATAI